MTRVQGGPDTRAGQLLAALRANPDIVLSARDLEDLTGIPAKNIGTALRVPMERATPGTPWSHVRLVTRARWVYDTVPVTPPPPAAGWSEAAPASDGGYVLRGPDGVTYLARPL